MFIQRGDFIMRKEITTNTANKTPIEIALQIDENGMTTASKLYAFLELDPSHFSRWCSKNIVKNRFATKNVDYQVFAMEGENLKVGRPKDDYRLTADFAKKLSMTGNTERHEEARTYFIACEQGLKIATQINNNNMKLVTETVSELARSVSSLTTTVAELQKEVAALKTAALEDKTPKRPKYSYWTTNLYPKYEILRDFYKVDFKTLYKNLFKEFSNTYPDADLNQLIEDYCYENKIETCYTMTAIEYDRTYRAMFEEMVNDLLKENGLYKENNTLSETIFRK
jgi:phage anti-repressor protein